MSVRLCTAVFVCQPGVWEPGVGGEEKGKGSRGGGGEGAGGGERGGGKKHSWILAFCISLLTASPSSRLSASESWLMSMSRFGDGELRSIGKFGMEGRLAGWLGRREGEREFLNGRAVCSSMGVGFFWYIECLGDLMR